MSANFNYRCNISTKFALAPSLPHFVEMIVIMTVNFFVIFFCVNMECRPKIVRGMNTSYAQKYIIEFRQHLVVKMFHDGFQRQ